MEKRPPFLGQVLLNSFVCALSIASLSLALQLSLSHSTEPFTPSTLESVLDSHILKHSESLNSEWIEYRKTCACMWDVVADKKIDVALFPVPENQNFDPMSLGSPKALLTILNALCGLAALLALGLQFKGQHKIKNKFVNKSIHPVNSLSHEASPGQESAGMPFEQAERLPHTPNFHAHGFSSLIQFTTAVDKLSIFTSAKDQILLVLSPDPLEKSAATESALKRIFAFENIMLKAIPTGWIISRYKHIATQEELYLIFCPIGNLSDVQQFCDTLKLNLEVAFLGDSRSSFSAGCAVFSPRDSMMRSALEALRFSQNNGGNCVTLPGDWMPHSQKRSQAV